MKIALDIGYRNTIIGWITNRHIQTAGLTSIFGRGHIRNMGTLEAGLNKAEIREAYNLTYNDISQVVGHNAHLHVKNIDGFKQHRFEDAATMKPLTYTALAQLPPTTTEISTVIGLPISVMEKTGERTIRGIRNWLGGHHSFNLDGINHTIQIDKIRGLAQPLGTWARFMFNDLGEWLHDKYAPCIVIDLGSYTLDILSIENRKLTPSQTIGENVGTHLAAENLSKQIRLKFGLDITLHQADLLLRNSLEHNRNVFYHPKGSDDITELIETALSDTFLKHNRIIADTLKNAVYRHLIGTGGGMLYHKAELIGEYPDLQISNDPINDNAAGLTIMAQKLF